MNPRLLFINEIIILAAETIGAILASFGLGVFAAWLTGVAGFLLVSGAGLIATAYIAAHQQAQRAAEIQAQQPPPGPPPGLVNTVETVQRYKAERQLDSLVRDGEPLAS